MMELEEMREHWARYASIEVMVDELRKDMTSPAKMRFVAKCLVDEAEFRERQ